MTTKAITERAAQKRFAKTLRRELTELGLKIPHQTLLEALSRALGYRDDNGAAASMTTKSEQPSRRRLLIQMEGGLIHAICSDRPSDFDDTDILVVDQDIEVLEEENWRIRSIQTSDSTSYDAITRFEGVEEISTLHMDSAFKAAQEADEDFELEEHINAMTDRLTSANAPEDCLDELVHESLSSDASDRLNADGDEDDEDILSASENRASEINNSGFRAQIREILQGWGREEGTRLVLEAANLDSAEIDRLYRITVRAIVKGIVEDPGGTAENSTINKPWHVYDYSENQAEDGSRLVTFRCDTLVEVQATTVEKAVEAAKANAPLIIIPGVTIESATLWVDTEIDTSVIN